MTGEVLVVGAGIAGLALTRALSLRGVSTTLVERLAAPPRSGMGLNLPANALRALADLGLADDVVDRGMWIRRREYRNASGRLLFGVDEERFWDGVGPSVCLRRGDLLEVLLAGVPDVTVRWGAAVVRAEPTETGVRVELSAGPVEEYLYVAGADGVHSTLRGMVTSGGTVTSDSTLLAFVVARRLSRTTDQAFVLISAFTHTRWLADLLDSLSGALDRNGVDLIVKLPPHDHAGRVQLA